MKATSATLVAKDNHQSWRPVLEIAAQEVFELMLSSTLTAPTTANDQAMDVTAMVGLAGQLCGVMSLRCGHQAAGMMASKMLGIDASKVGPEVCDAFGEVCNMIAGNFKNKVSGLGDGCLLSVPTVITGNDYCLHPMVDSPMVEVTLLFEGMPIVICLQVHS